MIHVAIDTNIYRQKPRLDSPEFKTLTSLAKNKSICLHVPFFVENEFKSYLESEQSARIKSVLSGLSKFKNVNNYSPHEPETRKLIKYFDEITGVITDVENKLIKERGEVYIKWMDDVGAKRYNLSKSETEQALDAYFQGKPPLKEPKIHKHIPDSFIYQSLLNIHKKNHSLHVVTEDKNLREACNKAGLSCYEKLIQFMEIDEVKTLLQGTIGNDTLDAIEDQLKTFLTENSESINQAIEEKLTSGDFSVISGGNIPGESNEIYALLFDMPYSVQFKPKMKHFGDGLFVVDFSAQTNILYTYGVYKSEAYGLDSEKYDIVDDLNDHYFNVETTDEFSFNGRVELKYSISLEKITQLKLHELLQQNEPSVSIAELGDFEIND